MMNILFLSQYYPNELLPIFLKQTKVGLDFAAHNLNKALFSGFAENGQSIHILNTPHVGSFPPYYRKPYILSYKDEEQHINSISYINVSFFKRFDIKRKIRKNLNEWCSQNKGEKVIILYNFDCIELMGDIKEKYKDVKVCLIVTDLKEYMAPRETVLTKINRLVTNLLMPEDIKWYDSIDAYVLLAERMKDKLPINNKPCMLMEGIYNSEINCESEKEKGIKIILYTGNLGRRYGLLDLLEAFSQTTDPNLRLWICGTGDSLNYYLKRQKVDKRIYYLGVLPREEVLKLQKKATVLINPRYSKDEYTYYSFPSKTMEYMASGTPVLMSKLKSLPEDYLRYLYFFDEESVDGFKKSIEEICSKSQKELDVFGAAASAFIMKNKTPKPQVERLLNFLNSL